MTRTAISPRLATRTLVNIRARHAIRPPLPRPPRTVDIQRSGPPPGPGRPAALRRRTRRSAALEARSAALRRRAVVTSDLDRARETAELLGYPGARLDARFREIDVGEWAGRPLADFPSGSEPAWRGGPLKAPDGESWEDLAGARRRRARRADRRRRHVARGLPRRRRPRRALARHRGRSAAGRRARERQRHGVQAQSPPRLEAYAWTPALSVTLTRERSHRKFPRQGAFEASRRSSHPGAFCRGAAQRWEPAGRHMGPPRRPVTPSTARATESARRPPAARRRPTGSAAPLAAAGGAVSRRNCSIAAITAAASSGEALLPCSSRRGRRFIRRAYRPLPVRSPDARTDPGGTRPDGRAPHPLGPRGRHPGLQRPAPRQPTASCSGRTGTSGSARRTAAPWRG